MAKVYVVEARDYWEASRLLRRLRRKKAVLYRAIFIVGVEDHRKIQGYLQRGKNITIILVSSH